MTKFAQKNKIFFLWNKSTLSFFHFFLPSSDDKKDQQIFSSLLFSHISSKRRVSFKQRFAIPKYAYVFWELFTVLVAFFYPQIVCFVVPWTDVFMQQNTAHLENRKACKNVELAWHHSQFLQAWRVCFGLFWNNTYNTTWKYAETDEVVHWSNLIKVDTDKVDMIEFDKKVIMITKLW